MSNRDNFNFGIQINNKEGKPFRKYTKDTLQMLFDTSPSAANFEMIIVIEGLVFMGIRLFYMISKQNNEYNKFIKDKKASTFYRAIEKLYCLGIIDESLQRKLHSYREQRNEIAHDLFQLKSIYTESAPKFKNFTHTDLLKKLFDQGLEIFIAFEDIITPGRPTQEEYLKKFSGYYKRTGV